jgi:flavin-dependent dehydrogenase
MGIVPIGNNQINVAILCRGEPLIPTNIEGTISDEGWVKVALPPFAKKRVPKWKNSYFFGDTLATIPPITGQGVALALYMGMEAAKKAVAGDVMVNPYKRQLFIGKLLHQVALKAPALSNALKWSPRLAHAAKRLTEIF